MSAAPISKGDIRIELEEVATGLTAPIGVTHAGDGSGRLFIVDQSGQIKIVENCVLLPTPFLDISAKLPVLGAFFDERGLLGLAFHPDYENNGRFFIRYSAPREGDAGEPCNDPNGFIVGCHSELVAEYHVSVNDPNLADPNSEIVLFSVDEPQFNHDSGEIAFGPDGFLYFTLGDGGGAHDGLADNPPSHGPIGNAQNIETALGSILRIDVDSPPQVPLAYAIPPDNPFVGMPGVDEIYAYGLRNPYKFSFDDGPGGDGSLFLADVGQNLFEEVNIVELGGNYGWVIKEGFNCFDPFNPLNPPVTCPDVGPMGEPLLDPIVEYSHPGSGFDPEGGITVIGGFVYRGSVSPGLFGAYVFGDFAQQFVVPSGSLYHLIEPAPGSFEIRQFTIGFEDRPYGLFLKGFGEDEDGEVYTCGSVALAPFGDTGVVHHLVVVSVAPICFGFNEVKIKNDELGLGDCGHPKGKNEIKIKGSLTPRVPIDFASDDVSYSIEDGSGVGFEITIPAGSFELQGNPDNMKWEFKGQIGDLEVKKAKFDLLNSKFEINIKNVDVPDLGTISGTTLTVTLQVGSNLGTEAVEMEEKCRELKFKRQPKLDCKAEGIAMLQVASDAGVFDFLPEPGEDRLAADMVVDDGTNGAVSIHTSGSQQLGLGDVFGPYVVTDVVKIYSEYDVVVESDLAENDQVFIDVSFMDLYEDGSDVTDFDLDYAMDSVVAFTAPEFVGNQRFLMWTIDGVPQAIMSRSTKVTVTESHSLDVQYIMPGDVNDDEVVDGRDIQGFVDVILQPGGTGFRELAVADTNGDGSADVADIGPFVACVLRDQCPN